MFTNIFKGSLFGIPISLIISLMVFSPAFLSCKSHQIISEEKKKRRDIGLVIYKYKSGNWEERIDAVHEISGYDTLPHSIRSLRLLIEATYDNHSAVRIEAINKLAGFPSLVSRNRLSELALGKNNSNEKWYALRALASYRDPLLAPIFINGLKSSDWLIRNISIKGILMFKKTFVEKSMIRYIILALRDPCSRVKLTTLNNLNIKNQVVYNEIKKIFETNSKRKVFTIASLKAMRGYRLDPETKNRVIRYLTDNNREIRILALRVLQEEESVTEEK
jgi:HEAT repeat protein